MKSDYALRALAVMLLFGGGAAWIGLNALSKERAVPPAGLVETSAEVRDRSPLMRDEWQLLDVSERDPLQAIARSRELASRAERARILSAALESLRRRHPALAAEIVAGLPAGDFQQIAAAQVAAAFARVDPNAAFSWAQGLGDDRTRLRAVREVAAVWAETDPKAATVAVATLGSERDKQLGSLAVATVWTRHDPRAALAWAATLQPQNARALVAGSAVQTWAERDAPAAMTWLVDQPTEFRSAIDPDTPLGILRQWTVQNPEAAREFVSRMTPGGEQARAVGIVAAQLAKSDPVATMLWALTLPHEAVRNGAFSTAFRQWREVAPQVAEAWLNAVDLTAEEKRRLVNYP